MKKLLLALPLSSLPYTLANRDTMQRENSEAGNMIIDDYISLKKKKIETKAICNSVVYKTAP